MRIVALAFASVLAAGTAAALLLAPGLLRAVHPLPLALSFLAIAALSLYLAAWLRRHGTE